MTQQHATPEEHSSVVGGSIAARRIGCPRSYTLEQMVPPSQGSAYTREGTALHEMIAQVLRNDIEPGSLLPFTFKREDDGRPEGAWEFTITEDLWYEVGQPALDAFDTFIDAIEMNTGGVFEFVIETRCVLPGIANAFGTADVIWSCGNLSGVWDWKFGRNRVSVEANDQLMFYARAAVSTIPAMFGAKAYGEVDPTREVLLSIMQPQVSEEPSEYRVTVGELEEWRNTLQAAVKSATEQGMSAPIGKGKWCDYATCKAVCPLWAGQSAAFGEKMAKLAEIQKTEGVKNLTDVKVNGLEHRDIFDHDALSNVGAELGFAEILPELLALADTVEGWVKQVRDAAFEMLEGGAQVDGWRIGISTTSRRTWGVDEAAVRKFFKNRRYKIDEYMPRQLITMPAAEKLLKRDDRAVPEDMIDKKVSTKNALVRADSALPASSLSSDSAKALGDKIAALTGGLTGV